MLLLLEVWELPGGGQPSKGSTAISQMGMKDKSEWRWKEGVDNVQQQCNAAAAQEQ
jgi:hypothetical protein